MAPVDLASGPPDPQLLSRAGSQTPGAAENAGKPQTAVTWPALCLEKSKFFGVEEGVPEDKKIQVAEKKPERQALHGAL